MDFMDHRCNVAEPCEHLQLLQQLELDNKAILKTHEKQLNRLKHARTMMECSLMRILETSALFNNM